MEELVLQAINGNKESFKTLITSVEKDLYRIAQAKLDNIDDINDTIQETILHAYDKLSSLKNPQFFKTWIIKILLNECNIVYKKRNKQLGIFYRLSNLAGNSNENDIHIVEDNIDFKMLISHLNKNEQEIFALHYNSNYTSTEIAELLDMNINTVKSIITRAKTKLQKYIREEDINNEKQKQ